MKNLMCSAGVHKWSGCQCSRCGQTRDEGHEYVGCTCRVCRKERFGSWTIDLREQVGGATPLCIYCDRLLAPDVHGKLHDWHVQNSGKQALLSYISAEGYVESSIWRVGEITEIKSDFPPSLRQEPPRRYYGTHPDSFATDGINANAVESTLDSLSEISAFKYGKFNSSNGDSMHLLVPCAADDSKGSVARWDLVLLEAFRQGGLQVFAPPLPYTKAVLSKPVFCYYCECVEEYEHPATALKHSGLYLISDGQKVPVHFGYSIDAPIAKTVKDDLDRKLYSTSCKVSIITLQLRPSQRITPRIIAAVYKSAICHVKPSASRPLEMPDPDADRVAVDFKK